MPGDGDNDGDNGEGTPFTESPSGIHRVYSDGTMWSQDSDGDWTKDPKMNPIIALLKDKGTRTIGIGILCFLAGGGGGFVSDHLWGDSAKHETLATKEQVAELTDAVTKANTRLAELEGEFAAHDVLPAHPTGAANTEAVSVQVTDALRIINEMHPRQR